MSKLRSVSTAFWSDPFIEDLTPNHKLLFLYLVTNEKTNMLGIYESSIKKISFETGLKKDDVLKGLKEFEKVNKVKYINNYVILINFMKHQKFNTNMKKSAIDIYNNLPKELKDSTITVCKSNPSKGFESLLKCFGMVSKVEVEVEDEIETKEEDENKSLPFSFYNSLLKLGADKQLASEWLKVRKTKKATNSQTAFNSFVKQLEKTNATVNEILELCVIKSWSGFKSEWYQKPNEEPKTKQQIYEEQLKKLKELHNKNNN